MLATLDVVRSAGFTPAVIAPPKGPLAEALNAGGIEVVPLAARDASGKRLPLGRRREELARLLRRRGPDLLHANSLAMGRLAGPTAAELGLPSIAHLRDIIKLSRQAVADLNRHTRRLAVSHATRDFHIAGGVAADKTHVLYNGVDLDAFRPRPASGYLHRELRLPPGTPLVGTIGQICLRKAQDVLARAAAIVVGNCAEPVAGAGPDAHYLFVGERFSQKEESRRFEAELRAAAVGPLAGRIHFLGYRTDVAAMLSELTLLAHPSRQEPLGRVLLEAAAAGVAVVATDVGGAGEIFPAGSHGARLVPPDDPKALAAAVDELLRDEPLRHRLGAAARRRAEAAFDIRHTADALVGHYRAIL